jgi:uncharacterized glyoxalase superfamily protein PhnB
LQPESSYSIAEPDAHGCEHPGDGALANQELAITTTQSPEQLIGVQVGSAPRFEMFVYVDDVDEVVAQLRGVDGRVLKEPQDMFWGERVAYVADPDGNPVALAAAAGSTSR